MSCRITKHLEPYVTATFSGAPYRVVKARCKLGINELTVSHFEINKSAISDGVTINIKLRIDSPIPANNTVTCELLNNLDGMVDYFDFICDQSTDVGVIIDYTYTEKYPANLAPCFQDVIVYDKSWTVSYYAVDGTTGQEVTLVEDASYSAMAGALLRETSKLLQMRNITGKVVIKTDSHQCIDYLDKSVSIPSTYEVETYSAVIQLGFIYTRTMT